MYIFASKNKAKIAAAERIAQAYGRGIQPFDPELPSRSGELRNAVIGKVRAAYDAYKVKYRRNHALFVMDSSFSINALNGWPGAHIQTAIEQLSIEGLLHQLKRSDVRGKGRGCTLRVGVAWMDYSKLLPFYAESKVVGRVAGSPRGELRDGHWSQLELILIPNGETKTLAEMGDEEYNSWRDVLERPILEVAEYVEHDRFRSAVEKRTRTFKDHIGLGKSYTKESGFDGTASDDSLV